MKIIAIPMSFDDKKTFINNAYLDYIVKSGYQPFMVSENANIDEVAKFCDGLVLAGGGDIDPTYYGDDNSDSRKCKPDKDMLERLVLHAFMKEGKPIFGICRGLQLIIREFILDNPEEKIDFEQHIPDHNPVYNLDLSRSVRSHSVKMDKQLLYGEGKTEKVFVNSIHHQAVIVNKPPFEYDKDSKLEIGALTKLGLKPNAGFIVEAIHIENFNGSEVTAVQWHPEELKDYKLLKTLFD